jgi:folate-binding protein YgfZ
MAPLGGTLVQRSRRPLVGQWAFDAFRITRGIPGAGSELEGAFTPNDVGLLDAVSFTKGCYIGQEVVARKEAYRKGGRTLTGVWAPRPVHSGSVLHQDGVEVGVVTACAAFALRGTYVGLGVAKGDAKVPGECAVVEPDGSSTTVELVPLPMDR